MDIKIMTGFLLWFCLIANISVSQSASARVDSRQRFRRENDESIACPEGTKACKNDEKICATYCDGNPECTDGLDELDCASSASALRLHSASIVPIPAGQSTQSIGEEIERVDVPSATTDMAQMTIPQIVTRDRDIALTAATDTTIIDGAPTDATEAPAIKEMQTATTVLAGGTTIVLPAEITTTIAAEVTTDTAAGAAGTTAVAADTTVEAAGTTVGAAGTTVGDAGTTAGAAGTTAGAADTTVGAADTTVGAAGTTAVAADTTVEAAGTTVGAADTTAGSADTTAGAAGTTVAAADTTAGPVDTTVGSADTTAGAVDTTVGSADTTVGSADTTVGGADTTAGGVEGTTIEAATSEAVTSVAAGDSTAAVTVDGTATTGDGVSSDAASTIGGGSSTGSVSDATTTIETITGDTSLTTNAGAETTKDATDVSSVSLPGDDTTIVTTIGSADTDDNGIHTTGIEETTVQPAPASRVELRVVVSPEIVQVQRGRTYEMTCSVYGADASTSIYWIQEEPERRYALIEPATADDKQVTMSQVSLKARITIDDSSKIGTYTCMAQDAVGNSGSAILTMQETTPYYPQQPLPTIVPGLAPSGGSGYLRIVAPDMAEGDYVEIQCEGATPEDEGRVQWFFNNRLLDDEQPLYPRGKTLHIRPISRAYLGNYRCSIPGSSYADANSVLTFGGIGPQPPIPPQISELVVSVEIVQGLIAEGQAQENTQVILRCRTSQQAASYRWTFTSSVNQATVDRGYSDQLVLPRVTVLDSGVYTCAATNTGGQSARGSTNLRISGGAPQPVSGRCSIDEATCRNGRCIPRAYLCDGKNDCGDSSDESCGPPGGSGSDACQPNEIRCTNYGRGRKCVQKFWMCDGDRDCDDGSDEESHYCELLPRQRYCKPSEFHCGGLNATIPNPVCIPRSFQCDGYNDCPDRSDELGCTKPTVVSSPQRQIQITVGQTLTIQCTARGSPAPYINWRLNWGNICGDGSDNGRCQMAQSIDPSDPSIVTGTLTVRNVNMADSGAYSCEALNNQGFIFAIPDAIVNVMIVTPDSRPTQPPQTCNCNGHSSYCSPDGRCLNCQHNTAGSYCEYCAPGYQGDARRGTPYDCQPIPVVSSQRCDPSGTYMERGGRCICKYNVEGDRCDQCKRSHFYLNPTAPNGCLPCFCSGVSTDCSSIDWRRKTVSLPLNNWNVVPKNFATDRYEAGDRIQQRNGGRELALDQSSLGRPANEVLYWKAPKEALGDIVTLYDGTIDIHFSNDGQDTAPPSNDEFIWLRGNNIDLVHKIPQTQRFKSNGNATYSVPCNERTFTRKDGTYIDRENILMALADVDTLLVKINPIGGRRDAVLRSVILNVAARDGPADVALTVESCRCPANYTGTSCEKCADGYGRPHPLVGIYLGQCLSCRQLCNDRSDRCDRDTGKCLDCQGNSEGDRCERCRPGYVLDARMNQCARGEQPQPYPAQPSYETGSRGAYYVDQQPYDARSQAPLSIVLDGNRSEQRVPLQVLNAQPRSVVWGRTDGSSLPPNVFQEGPDLVFRNPSIEQAGNYICAVTHPDSTIERIAIYLEYRPGQPQTIRPVYSYPVFSPAGPLNIVEGASQLIQPQGAFDRVQWRRDRGQPLPSGFYQTGNALQISGARPDHSGVYYCELINTDGTPVTIPYEIHVEAGARQQPSGGGPPRISIEPRIINLKEGQRMIVQYTVSSQDPITVTWNKLTNQGYEPIPALFAVENDRLVLNRATPDAAGTYQVVVRNANGEDRQELRINVEPRRARGRGQQSVAPQVRLEREQYAIGAGEVVDIIPNISGTSGATISWSKDGSSVLPDGVTARNDGALHIEGRSDQIDGRYNLEVINAYGRVSTPLYIRWKDAADTMSHTNANQHQRAQWNVQRLDLDEGRRLEAVCRTDIDPATLRLEITRAKGGQREQAPLGLSFSNGYLSLGAVTRQDNGLQFICSSGDISDTLTLNVASSSNNQDDVRSSVGVRFESRDEQSHQIGREIYLQCSVQGNVERPYEYRYTKDGGALQDNVEVHPNGLLIVRNAQAADAGRYRCEVTFPRAPELGSQESNYDLRIEGASGESHDQGSQHNTDVQQYAGYVEASIEPSEVTLARGAKVNLTCLVKGAQKYTITWSKYAHDTSLPSYAHQQNNSVILAPIDDSPAEQMYLQCQVIVPGNAQPILAYAPVTIRAGDDSRKKKKKRRS